MLAKWRILLKILAGQRNFARSLLGSVIFFVASCPSFVEDMTASTSPSSAQLTPKVV